MRIGMAVLMVVSISLASQANFSADREGSAETFLCRDGGHWASARRANGNVILFIFGRGDQYCGGETRDSLTTSCGRYEVWGNDGQFYLKLTEKTGKVIRMPLEIKNDYTIILNGVELRRQIRGEKEGEGENRAASDTDEKVKSEVEREEKAIRDRNYRRMKEAVAELDERCQKKRDELDRQWRRNFPGSSSRADILHDLESLNKDCENERKQIRKMYGFD
jgi:hypothetical protein